MKRLAWLILSCLLGAAPARAEVKPWTVTEDYRNRPDVAAACDSVAAPEWFILSPHVEAATLARVRSFGTKVAYWLQPFLLVLDGRPSGVPYQRRLFDLATRHGAIVRDADGRPVSYPFDAHTEGYLMDFGDSAFVRELAQAQSEMLAGADGVLLDYGCRDQAWWKVAQSPVVDWSRWGAGYRAYREQLRALQPAWAIWDQCDQWWNAPPLITGNLFELAGHDLQPYDKLWANLTRFAAPAAPESVAHSIVRQEDDLPARRRLLAALCMLTDSYFARMDGTRAPEFYELYPGPFAAAPLRVADGVYERVGAHGVAIANLSDRPYTCAPAPDTLRLEVPPRDGLVIRWSDPRTGAAIPWRSDAGR